MLIDGLQYCNWSPKIFRQWRDAKIDCVHVTIAYHEMFRETISNISQWHRWFENHPDLITQAFTADDIEDAHATGRTAVIFGFQNASPMEDDIGLLEILYRLGGRFMQLTYNNQSLLAAGCYEDTDSGLTRMGCEVIQEMNRLGMVVDMSHSADRSTLEAIDASARPIAISHANPAFWHPARRNKSDSVLKALAARGGMLGLSLYPHHLKGGSDCRLDDFCRMIAMLAEKIGTEHIGFGSDLCQDQPDSIVQWMRVGRWTKKIDHYNLRGGEGSKENIGFPQMPTWFQDNRHWHNILKGLDEVGFSPQERDSIAGGNWLKFFRKSFGTEN